MATVYKVELVIVSDNTAYPNELIANTTSDAINSFEGLRCTDVKVKQAGI